MKNKETCKFSVFLFCWTLSVPLHLLDFYVYYHVQLHTPTGALIQLNGQSYLISLGMDLALHLWYSVYGLITFCTPICRFILLIIEWWGQAGIDRQLDLPKRAEIFVTTCSQQEDKWRTPRTRKGLWVFDICLLLLCSIVGCHQGFGKEALTVPNGIWKDTTNQGAMWLSPYMSFTCLLSC